MEIAHGLEKDSYILPFVIVEKNDNIVAMLSDYLWLDTDDTEEVINYP